MKRKLLEVVGQAGQIFTIGDLRLTIGVGVAETATVKEKKCEKFFGLLKKFLGMVLSDYRG